jgi:hypothetical protein
VSSLLFLLILRSSCYPYPHYIPLFIFWTHSLPMLYSMWAPCGCFRIKVVLIINTWSYMNLCRHLLGMASFILLLYNAANPSCTTHGLSLSFRENKLEAVYHFPRTFTTHVALLKHHSSNCVIILSVSSEKICHLNYMLANGKEGHSTMTYH